MSALLLNIHDISETGKDYSFPLTSSWLASMLEGCDVQPDAAGNEGSVRVHAQKNGAEYLVTGDFEVEVVTACYRCLEDAHVHVEAEITALFAEAATARKIADDEEVDENEIDYEVFSGHEIALDGFLREQILLEVPMQPLCKEDCAGIPIPEHIRPPADFGREDVDPRLAPLKNLAVSAKAKKE